MDPNLPFERNELNILPDEEVERLELLEVASAALIAHAETLAERELLAEARHAA